MKIALNFNLPNAAAAQAGFPIGLLQEKLIDVLPDDPRRPKRQKPVEAGPDAAPRAAFPQAEKALPYTERSYDSTAAVIAQLEASMQKERPHR